MSELQITQGSFRLSDTRTLRLPSLKIISGESWAFVGANGSGKSALARALSDELLQLEGKRYCSFHTPVRLSFEQLQKLIDEEWQRNNTDLLSEGEEDTGRTAADIIQLHHKDNELCLQLSAYFGIKDLLSRRFKYLSTGEIRKVLLCQALMMNPDLLILDEPFDGLDTYARNQLAQLLGTLAAKSITLVLILTRFHEIPDFVEKIGVLADCHLTLSGEKERILAESLVAQLAHSEKLHNIHLPEKDVYLADETLPDDQALVSMRNVIVKYHEKPILHGLNWQVNPHEHWQIIGENGSGKSTLLSLITGDHPQGYSNDLVLFGKQRGSGETIWDIKRHIGYVSNRIHLEYRVNTNIRNVILSGFFDSIGLYQAVSDRQNQLANEWLNLLGLSEEMATSPFHSLSWGQQRLVLIARALVKHPSLLILDEPLQGLDPLNRQLVLRFIDVMITHGNTQLLFVSHHEEDSPECITHRLRFVPDGDIYQYETDTIISNSRDARLL
ncbi:molybdate ABC transporter ATP-binding protein ModF [Xenorhabdus nematophila]|uniref:molybdate ABC transporter ATP-binding protein ModF n=1 Tax=Xenorhabdus nematophila TaxID=628 RepID=UPI000543C52C|nr:molybdate ABC transporter ATP-binding protein ModF [Xenorhabdus nematophila]CEF33462.1 molybdenum transport protein (ABC superfamily, atp_bind) [Xenorhabdus nematophila str. Websteri]AYA39704.1 molybdate ABC transporter ATP-binding protein ModF [Xenorhabdus nematophila]MBA0018274.1 molybdate ABC transporter ATP-binding protein ModF [Xenorhabdus nematophila]MCB4425871.1 molybdate ABC transporter ATP-binding protein ModF [Xenorhabdus nematophila]QNJ37354.1 molybdate ABC transporter ATP-bindin